ncbi:hypothetical protein [Kitasatospora phosalacinea]|uniref:Uncharacterized protein n=1 Tax=Kitasatospora phosalacinea TaxID=2065 RepID=A0A9W6PN83_9ACTN|nr:hypothetical protein [Kitasatospora phosalacinea]GLW58097.1 hypothetical protein Kpho01_61080 [Kitasatospora phosalacinea]
MSEPIQPASVRKAGERTDGDSDDMPVVDATVQPPTASAPVPPPRPSEPPTAGTTSGSAGAGAPSGPGSWWRDADTSGPASSAAPVPAPVPVHAGGGSGWSGGGGGTATMVAPVYLPPAPVTYTYNHIVQAAPAAPLERRFDVRRIRPVRNGLALAIGTVIARAVWNPVLHVFGDEPGVLLAGLVGALLLEWAHHDKLKIRWLVRVHTCSWAAAGIVTPAGLLGIAFIGTGAA